jgi:KDO2-lipid IV(A) lauroyltransferase
MESAIGRARGRRRDRQARRRPVRHFLEYAGLRLIGLVLAVLPIDLGTAMMAGIWRSLAPRLHRHPRALAHLELAFPEKTAAEREKIARDMWSHLGRVFAESFMIERLVASKRVENRAAEALRELKATQRPLVFVSLHAGNWELVALALTAADIKVAGVYQKIKNPFVDHYLSRLRRDRYPRGLFAKGNDIGRRLMRIVRDGGAVALLADLRDRRGVTVPFFGEPAPSTPFPAFLARTSNAILVAGRTIRVSGSHFAIESAVVEVPHTDDRDADIEEATRRLQALFESWIREHPEQWMWAHRRWG